MGLLAFVLSKPWLVQGDFNTVRSAIKKVGGNRLKDKHIKRFNNTLLEAGLFNLNTKGMVLTWSNRQIGRGRILGRLDRALVNSYWSDAFSSSVAVGLHTGSSDHSPILVCLDNAINWGPKPFKYNNYWGSDKDFADVINLGWNAHCLGNPQFCVAKKLKAV